MYHLTSSTPKRSGWDILAFNFYVANCPKDSLLVTMDQASFNIQHYDNHLKFSQSDIQLDYLTALVKIQA